MADLNGRFTGTQPQRLDRVIQSFLSSQSSTLKANRAEIHNWITQGSVAIDGHIARRVDAEVRPGSFIKIRIP